MPIVDSEEIAGVAGCVALYGSGMNEKGCVQMHSSKEASVRSPVSGSLGGVHSRRKGGVCSREGSNPSLRLGVGPGFKSVHPSACRKGKREEKGKGKKRGWGGELNKRDEGRGREKRPGA